MIGAELLKALEEAKVRDYANFGLVDPVPPEEKPWVVVVSIKWFVLVFFVFLTSATLLLCSNPLPKKLFPHNVPRRVKENPALVIVSDSQSNPIKPAKPPSSNPIKPPQEPITKQATQSVSPIEKIEENTEPLIQYHFRLTPG